MHVYFQSFCSSYLKSPNFQTKNKKFQTVNKSQTDKKSTHFCEQHLTGVLKTAQIAYKPKPISNSSARTFLFNDIAKKKDALPLTKLMY